jgi:cell division protein FtsQ
MAEQEDNPRMLWSVVLMAGLVLAIGALAVGANVWKQGLHVRYVRVSGNAIVGEKEVVALAGIPEKEKLYAVDLFAARKRIEQNIFVKSASVNREAPDGISITVRERVPVAALVLDRVLYLDAEGVVLPPVRSDGVFDLPLLTGRLPAAECVPGKRISSADVLEALDILVTAGDVGEDLSHLVSEVHIGDNGDMMLTTADAGVPVAFGRGNIPAKLVIFDGFWKNIVVPRGTADLHSVDLRFDGQVVARWAGDDGGVN